MARDVAPSVHVHKRYLIDGEDAVMVITAAALLLPVGLGLLALVVLAWRYAFAPLTGL